MPTPTKNRVAIAVIVFLCLVTFVVCRYYAVKNFEAAADLNIARITGGMSYFGNPDQFLLLSLDHTKTKKFTNNDAYFHCFSIIGRTPIKDKQLRKQLLRDIFDVIPYSERPKNDNRLLTPHYGISLIKGKETLDFIPDFDSQFVLIYHRHGLFTTHYFRGKGRSDFDGALKQANIPIAP